MILEKFLDHQPLYRQAEALKRDHDWALSPATMGKWVERVAVSLRPLYDALVDRITATDYVQMDESGIRVLSADEPGASHRGWMRLVRDPATGAVAFRYDRGRSAKVPASVLAGFDGVLQTDGYRAYAKALKGLRAGGADIRRVGCLAHIRRKFFEAKDSDPAAKQALGIIQRIYALEARWRGYPPERRLGEREVQLAPAFAELSAWLDRYEHQPIPKTPLGKAIGYARPEWPTLAIALEDGRVELDARRHREPGPPAGPGPQELPVRRQPRGGRERRRAVQPTAELQSRRRQPTRLAQRYTRAHPRAPSQSRG